MMSAKTIWTPPEDWLETTRIGALTRRLGLAGYDALLEISLREPDRYWSAALSDLRVRWRVPPTEYVRLDRGPAFPDWFGGGELNWADTIFGAADSRPPDDAAVIGESEDGAIDILHWGELRDRVLRLAAGLRRHGIEAGDRVGLMTPMSVPAVLSFLAIGCLGAIAVPLFTGFSPEAATLRLRLAGARWLVASATLSRRGIRSDASSALEAIRQAVEGLELVVVGETTAHAASWDEVREASALSSCSALPADTPFMLVFTSGTTGLPKGTVHTHAGFPLKILHDAAYHFDIRQGDRWLWPTDMGWIVGPITVVGALGLGATLICYAGAPDYPTAGRLVEVIRQHGVTHFGASPTLVRMLAASRVEPGVADLRSLKLLMLAGEVIDPEHFEWLSETFGRGSLLPLINYTGGTEASGAILASVPARPIKVCGFNSVSPSVDAFAADARGERVREVIGELTIAAPFVGMTRSFWNAEERYFEAYWSRVPGLWTHGDLVIEDADGHFFVLGRSDDTLKIAGKRVGPAEIESAALALPFVTDAAAVGVDDDVKGQQIVLCVTSSADWSEVLAAQLAEHVGRTLGKPFKPSKIVCVSALPRTRNGKVMRRVIRNALNGRPLGDLTSLDNPDSLDSLQQSMQCAP